MGGNGHPETGDLRPRRLRKRHEFLAAARGTFRAMPHVVVQMRRRDDDGPPGVGFTTTKRIGKAVVRNRARRRMREVVRQLPEGLLQRGRDYVFIAREGTAECPYGELAGQIERAVKKLNAGKGYAARPRPRRKGPRKGG